MSGEADETSKLLLVAFALDVKQTRTVRPSLKLVSVSV